MLSHFQVSPQWTTYTITLPTATKKVLLHPPTSISPLFHPTSLRHQASTEPIISPTNDARWGSLLLHMQEEPCTGSRISFDWWFTPWELWAASSRFCTGFLTIVLQITGQIFVLLSIWRNCRILPATQGGRSSYVFYTFFPIASLGVGEIAWDLPGLCCPLCDGRECRPLPCQVSTLSMNDLSLTLLFITWKVYMLPVFVMFCFCLFVFVFVFVFY